MVRYRPLTEVTLTRLWPHARKQGYEKGQRYYVNYYCRCCGTSVIWFFNPRQPQEIWTVDQNFLEKHFKLEVASRERSIYGDGKPAIKNYLRSK